MSVDFSLASGIYKREAIAALVSVQKSDAHSRAACTS